MALMQCKECGNEVSNKAESCPKCGVRIAAKPMGCGKLIGVIFLVVVIVNVFSIIFFSDQRSDETAAVQKASMTPEQKQAQADEALMSDAKWQCKQFVEKTLKAPSTADFQNYNDFSAWGSEAGGGPFGVTGYVDAQNSFGAKIRTNFRCELRKSGSDWQLVNITTTP